MKVLVTGSSGMIGSELIPELEKKGHLVVGLDRELPVFTDINNFKYHDLVNPLPSDETIDLVVHLAANARVWNLTIDPSLALENTISTHNIFEFARKSNAKIMVASSREVYGNGNVLPVSEIIGSQRSAESPYAASKVFGEALAWAYMNSYKLDTKIIRFSNVYGKYDFSDRFIPKVIKQAKVGETVEIWDKRKILDFTYISDTVAGVVHLVENWDMATQKEYNIAYGKYPSLDAVARKLITMLNSRSEVVYGETKPGEVFEYEADITRMKTLGWEPKVTLDEGLTKSIEYYAEHQAA